MALYVNHTTLLNCEMQKYYLHFLSCCKHYTFVLNPVFVRLTGPDRLWVDLQLEIIITHQLFGLLKKRKS